MKFNIKKGFLKFSNDQRKAIVLLLGIIITAQFFYFFAKFDNETDDGPEKLHWISLQQEIDSLKVAKGNNAYKTYPYNPNFITDYKGYKLGMSVVEIDRLHEFRKLNKYVNSAKEFQDVTKVSDSLLQVMAVDFKFPEWVTIKGGNNKYVKFENKAFAKIPKVQMDINQASQEDLVKVYGVGAEFSKRILEYKERLGCFVSMDQIAEVWGLSPEAIQGVASNFKISSTPGMTKLDINNASLNEISKFPYFKYALARKIVTYRSMNGNFANIEDLIKINGFPAEKAKIIALYLSFD